MPPQQEQDKHGWQELRELCEPLPKVLWSCRNDKGPVVEQGADGREGPCGDAQGGCGGDLSGRGLPPQVAAAVVVILRHNDWLRERR